MSNLVYVAPFRSLAAALILVIVFGPIGLFYSSAIGGIVMMVFGLVGLGMVVKMHSPLPMATVWIISIVWGMLAVRYYNAKLLKQLLGHKSHHHKKHHHKHHHHKHHHARERRETQDR